MDRPDDFLQSIQDEDPGHFSLDNQEGRIILTVYPPGKKGKAVRPSDVFARLDLFGMDEYDAQFVEEAVYASSGEPVAIGKWKEPQPIDGEWEVIPDESGMSAVLKVSPPRFKGRAVTPDDVHKTLNDLGIVKGVLFEEIENMCNRATPGFDVLQHEPSSPEEQRESIDAKTGFRSSASGGEYRRGKESRGVIARGKEPEAGSHGTVRFYFDPHPGHAPVQDEADPNHVERVDFKNLDVIQTCNAGDLLAEIVEATPGSSGYNIYGQEILPQDVREATLYAKKNARLEDGGRSIRAEIDGQVKAVIEGGGLKVQIFVDEILRVEKVDYSTGHIDFPGTVLVHETVLDGFRVVAKGDIVVEKSVGNIRLEAGGDIVLHGGVVSRGEGYIKSDSSIYARFAESAILHAKKGIYVEEAIMHCRVTAGELISIDGGRGELIGGLTICGKILHAKKIGARVGTPTHISVGIDPDTLEKLEELEAQTNERKDTLRKVENHLARLEEAQKRGKTLTEKEKQTKTGLLKIREKFASIIHELDGDREKIYSTITPDPESEVVALEAVYPGVEVSFGAGIKKYRVQRDPRFKYCRFFIEKNEIILRHSDL